MIHEPMTLATDYLLGVVAMVCAVKLWRSYRMWALAFAFTAAASFFGGTYHGLTPVAPLWKGTVLSVGLASFFLLAGYSRRFAAFAVVKLIVYSSWMIAHDDFVWVIADYGTTLVLIGIATALRRDRATPWILGSIVVSVAGALVQMSGVRLHAHFNHNDLYHVIQTVAVVMLYRAGRELAGGAGALESSDARGRED
ncbi:MAG TPA: hypothetical protein VGF48_07600 [Thermoanaerobaculia bacterium]|jgi:hypothetical protein